VIAQSSAVTMHVKDLEQAIRFYTHVLGFSEQFRFADYAGVAINDVKIHLSGPASTNKREVGQGCIYIFCDRVDEFYEQATARGLKAQAPPQDYPYGMRDFVAEDPDGNLITFGCEC